MATSTNWFGPVGSSGLAPSTSVLDNFNRANGAPGSNWGQAVASYSLPNIVSNALDFPQFPSAAWKGSGTPFAADQEIFVKSTSSVELGVRFNNLNTGSETGISVRVDPSNTVHGNVTLYNWTAGVNTRTTVAFHSAQLPIMTGTTWWLWALCQGSTLTLYVSNDGTTWTQADQFTGLTTAGAGYLVLFHPNNTAPGNIDDFGGGALSATPPGGPVNTVLPVITGTPTVGSVLSATPGTWNPPQSTFAWRWRRANDTTGAGVADISGATSSTYQLQTADVGKYITVGVTPQAVGSAPALSYRPTLPQGTLVDKGSVEQLYYTNVPQTIQGLYVHGVRSGDRANGVTILKWPAALNSPAGKFVVQDLKAVDIGNWPTTYNGTGEAGIWLGQEMNATRLWADGSWMGIWTGGSLRDSVIDNFTIIGPDGTSPGKKIGVYCEHFTRRVTFQNGYIYTNSTGINCEWVYSDSYGPFVNAEYSGRTQAGKAGTFECTFQDLVIYCPPNNDGTTSGIFVDAGNWGNIIRRIHFWGPGDAIWLPNNLAGNTNNFVDVASCIFDNSGGHVQYHSRGIGA